jgi:uncharacterized protein
MYVRKDTKLLEKYLKIFPVVVLLGARQVGKTTLARQIAKSIKKMIYIDLEDNDDFNSLVNPKLFFDNFRDQLIIIDEVQRMPELFANIRAEVDIKRKASRFILLGSASLKLLKVSSESLAGRVVYHHLGGLALFEVNKSVTINHHWLRGGYPEALKQKTIQLWHVWMASFIQTYMERDLPMLGLATRPQILMRLMQMLAYNHSQIINRSEYAAALGISVPTVSNIIDYFEGSYLIRILEPYVTNVKKRVSKLPKIYIRDSGMLHHFMGTPNMKRLLANPKVGFSWEGYVIEQLILFHGSTKSYFYYRTQDGTEADLVICNYNTPEYLIEVKLNSKPIITKSLINSLNDLNLKKAFIIVPGTNVSYVLGKEIKVMSLDSYFKI